MAKEDLWVVMPVYNEQGAIRRVLDEWVPVLRESAGPGRFVLLALNDGSKDNTSGILHEYAGQCPELKVVDKPNSGHGQACISGYRMALDHGAPWVFQIDSDGQCDPRFFPQLWGRRQEAAVIYGFRNKRDDGFIRYLISRAVSMVIFLRTAMWVRDPNVPYRLMRADALSPLLTDFPKDFHLANVLLAALQNRKSKIHWVNIHFRRRSAGVASVKNFSFVKQGLSLWKQMSKRTI